MRGGLRRDGASAKMAPQRSKVQIQKSPYELKPISNAKISVAFMFLRSIQAYLGM